MNKTKLGISTNLLAFAAILLTLFGGYIPALLVTGYILIAESDFWLKKVVVKAFAVSMAFTLLLFFFGFLPDLLGLINDVFNLWGGYFSVNVLNAIITLIRSIIGIVENIVMIVLAFMALGGKWFKIGFIDKFVEKHFA